MNLRKWLPLILIVSLAIALDQISKNWVIENMTIGETFAPLPALQPFFQFTRSTNTGIAFGIASGSSEIFFVISSLITIALVIFYGRSRANAHLQHIALSMVIGGALGNLLDRWQHGHVVDFIHYVIPGLISNVSNLADHLIVIGVFVLIVESFLEERRQAQHATASEAPTV